MGSNSISHISSRPPLSIPRRWQLSVVTDPAFQVGVRVSAGVSDVVADVVIWKTAKKPL